MGYLFYKGKQYADEVMIDLTLNTESGHAIANRVVATNISTINTELDALDVGKQDLLIAGTNIKTINSQSILGSGDLVIGGGSYVAGAGIEISNNTINVNATVRSGAASGATSLQPSDVKNNTTSTDTDKPLSANMGKSLQDQVNNLKNIGRFLSIWNASTGTPSTEPTESPYSFKVGDYYRVGTAGTKNPANNSTYVIGDTNYVEGENLGVGDVVYVSNISGDTSTWVKQAASGGGTVQDVQINTATIIDSGTGIANINLGSGLTFDTSTKTLNTAQIIQVRDLE